jgi:plastocyanin
MIERVTASLRLAGAVAFFAGAACAFAAQPYVVSQAGRMFHPRELTINRGEAIDIVNDDGDLLHHAYIDSEKMSFDSGDQKPGTKITIVFPVIGDFNVLCGIHPKMKLVVHVH